MPKCVLEVELSQRTLPSRLTLQLPGLVVIVGDLCGNIKFEKVLSLVSAGYREISLLD